MDENLLTMTGALTSAVVVLAMAVVQVVKSAWGRAAPGPGDADICRRHGEALAKMEAAFDVNRDEVTRRLDVLLDGLHELSIRVKDEEISNRVARIELTLNNLASKVDALSTKSGPERY